jgi:hypothetical protein
MIIRPPVQISFRELQYVGLTVDLEVCRALPAMKQRCLRKERTWNIIISFDIKDLGY